MDKKEKLCIKDAVKAKFDYLKSWAKRYEDELRVSGLIVGTAIGSAAIGFVAGRNNGYFSGLDDGLEIGTEIGKSNAMADLAKEILLSAMNENSTENVK